MSSNHVKAVFYLEIPSSHKIVLLAIAQAADKDGCCYPGQGLLSQMTSMHIRTVQRSLEWLEKQSYIKRNQRRRDNGYRTSDHYCLNLSGTESPDLKSPDTLSPDSGYDLTRQSVQSQAAERRSIKITRRITSEQPDIELPSWLPEYVWKSFKDMRIRIRKPMTQEAERLNINKLERWYSQGHDPTAIVENSVMNSYQGLFEPKNKQFTHKGKNNDIDNQLAELLDANGRGQLA